MPIRDAVKVARGASAETLDLLTRLESDQRSHWEVLSATRDQVTTLSAEIPSVRRDIMAIGAQIQGLSSKFDESRRPNWAMVGALVTLLPLAFTGFAFFMTAQVTGSVAPLKTEMAQASANIESIKTRIERIATTANDRDKDVAKVMQANDLNDRTITAMTASIQRLNDLSINGTQADENSKTDRAQLNRRMADLEQRVAADTAERRANTAETRVHLGEIEQQFHAVSNIANIREAWQGKINSILWEKAHPGERWPDATFHPSSIFQRSPSEGAPSILPPTNSGR